MVELEKQLDDELTAAVGDADPSLAVEQKRKTGQLRAKLSRRSQRGHITRILGVLDTLATAPEPEIIEVEAKLTLLEKMRDKCATTDEEIQLLTPLENLEAEMDDALLYHDNLEVNIFKLRRRVQELKTPAVAQPADPSSSSSGTTKFSAARLPKLTLPTFSGDVLEFTTYMELFDANVHDVSTLTDVQRFSYLRTTLEGEPATLVSNLELTTANYATARATLQDRYGDEAKIVEEHYRRLLRLDPKRETYQDLRDFYNRLELHVRGLETQGRPQNTYGDLLAMILMDKLSNDLRRCLARDHRTKTWTLADLIDRLKRELLVMEQDGKASIKTPAPATSTAAFYTNTQDQRKTRPSGRGGSAVATFNPRPIPGCHFCNGSHKAPDCTKFTTHEARLHEARAKRLCFNCLRTHSDGTRAVDCTGGACRVCNLKHHTALHRQRTPMEEKLPTKPVNSTFVDATTGGMLKTFIGNVTFGGKVVKASVLLDDGSTDSFCTERLAQRLNLPQTTIQRFAMARFGSLDHEEYHYPTSSLTLRTLDGDVPMTVVIVPRICQPSSPSGPRLTSGDVEKLHNLQPANTTKSGAEIDLLIASDYYYAIVKDTIIHLDCGLVAVDTRCGYLLCGGPLLRGGGATMFVSLNRLPDYDDEQLVEWQETTSTLCDDSSPLLTDFFANLTRNEQSGQYVAMLPFLPSLDKNDVPRNRGAAYHRSRTMVERFAADPVAMEKLKTVFADYVTRGFIERTSEEALAEPRHSFLPWQAVYKSTSVHTKMRIVFDCSCRDKMSGHSLNDFLWKGPNLTNNLVQILLRFRLPAIGIAADIEKAFLAIKIRDEDRRYLRFFYLDNPTKDEKTLAVYNFKVNIFGSRASSFILAAVLQQHLSLYTTDAARDMETNILVDNVVTGVADSEAAQQYFHESRSILRDAAMNLREWSSNDVKLRNLAITNGASGPSTTHVLGVIWDTDEDSISLKPFTPQTPRFWTKRRMLSDFHRVFDPYGWLSPVTIAAKLVLQAIWKLGLNWDDKIPDDACEQWIAVSRALQDATAVAKRRIAPGPGGQYELNIFVDSSMQAYCAAAYLNGQLLCAKAKTAPIKQRTIPELELMAMVLGTTLAEFLREALCRMKIVYTTHFFSDSQVCLAWVTSSKTLRPFVANRVRRIRDCGAMFRYVPTALNPADCATRGTVKMFDSVLWWCGPGSHELKGAVTPPPSSSLDNGETGRIVQTTCSSLERTLLPSRFDTFSKLLRVATLVIEFAQKLRREGCIPHIVNARRAFLLVVRESQQDAFPDVLNSLEHQTKNPLVQQLRLFLDDDGLVRCAGRFSKREGCTEDERSPILLGKDTLARLIVLDCHLRTLHGGVGSTLVLVRSQFWIAGGRRFIRGILRFCVTCRRVNGRPYGYPLSPALPDYRVNRSPPFSATGIDYTGHLLVKTSTGIEKRYIALFACCVTRAIHLEVAVDLSADHFMMLLRRFSARRSLPTTIVTDNATYFNSARDDLQQILADPQVADYLRKKNIAWINIPGRSPAWGGLYERLIGVMKASLKKVLGRALVSDAELITLVTEIEAAINNRPLTYFEDADDPNAVLPLTPSHLLHGRTMQELPYIRHVSPDDVPAAYNTGEAQDRVAYRGALMEQLWKRWEHEYLSALRERHTRSARLSSLVTPRVDDVVQVFEDAPRTTWRLARVTELLPGDDGQVRAVKLVSKGSILTRAINKLYPLELDCDSPNLDDPPPPQHVESPVPKLDEAHEMPNSNVEVQDEVQDDAPEIQDDAPTVVVNTDPQPQPPGRVRRAAFNRATSWLKTVTADLAGGGSMS